jgi:hypothetical protein
MLVDIKFDFSYFLVGVFLTLMLIYIQLPPPEIYELNKEKFDNKCF